MRYFIFCLLPFGIVSAANLRRLHSNAGAEEESQWMSCKYNWNTTSKAKVASRQWSYSPELGQELGLRRSQQKIAFRPPEKLAQAEVQTLLMTLMNYTAVALDKLNVNWYVAYGSAVGIMRHQTFIPWDADIDILVKDDQRLQVVDFIAQGGKRAGGWAFRAVPDHPTVLMAGYVDGSAVVKKVLFVDIESEVAIDFCFDCGSNSVPQFVPTARTMLGNVEVNMPKNPWVLSATGVDRTLKQISMTTAGDGWSCTAYTCTAAPPLATSAASLKEEYSRGGSALKGPFIFHMDDGSASHINAQCSISRDLSSCSVNSAFVMPQVWVSDCNSSPWSSATPKLFLVQHAVK